MRAHHARDLIIIQYFHAHGCGVGTAAGMQDHRVVRAGLTQIRLQRILVLRNFSLTHSHTIMVYCHPTLSFPFSQRPAGPFNSIERGQERGDSHWRKWCSRCSFVYLSLNGEMSGQSRPDKPQNMLVLWSTSRQTSCKTGY